MTTDQWVCKCGTHNSFLRKKCRNYVCRLSQAEGKVTEETCMEVIGLVETHNMLQKLGYPVSYPGEG